MVDNIVLLIHLILLTDYDIYGLIHNWVIVISWICFYHILVITQFNLLISEFFIWICSRCFFFDRLFNLVSLLFFSLNLLRIFQLWQGKLTFIYNFSPLTFLSSWQIPQTIWQFYLVIIIIWICDQFILLLLAILLLKLLILLNNPCSNFFFIGCSWVANDDFMSWGF